MATLARARRLPPGENPGLGRKMAPHREAGRARRNTRRPPNPRREVSDRRQALPRATPGPVRRGRIHETARAQTGRTADRPPDGTPTAGEPPPPRSARTPGRRRRRRRTAPAPAHPRRRARASVDPPTRLRATVRPGGCARPGPVGHGQARAARASARRQSSLTRPPPRPRLTGLAHGPSRPRTLTGTRPATCRTAH